VTGLRLLLDEHYPPHLATMLTGQGVDTVAILSDHPELLGATDTVVLRTAADLGRVVVTEDVSTFPVAIRAVPDHVGFIYCRSAVFHRNPDGIGRIAAALSELAQDPPPGLGTQPLVWWL